MGGWFWLVFEVGCRYNKLLPCNSLGKELGCLLFRDERSIMLCRQTPEANYRLLVIYQYTPPSLVLGEAWD